jgi:hypothetical protein
MAQKIIAECATAAAVCGFSYLVYKSMRHVFDAHKIHANNTEVFIRNDGTPLRLSCGPSSNGSHQNEIREERVKGAKKESKIKEVAAFVVETVVTEAVFLVMEFAVEGAKGEPTTS